MAQAPFVPGWPCRPPASLAGEDGEARLLKALQSGLAKVMSKMGISVLDSYRAAQLFDILGLDATVVERCFPGSLVTVGRMGISPRSKLRFALRGAPNQHGGELPDFGWVRFRRDERAEPHLWEPQRTRRSCSSL